MAGALIWLVKESLEFSGANPCSWMLRAFHQCEAQACRWHATEDEAVLSKKDKDTYEVDYPDVAAAPHAQLLSLSVETYGRWGKDCLRLVKELAGFG
jgi:hypothetical protein